MKLFIVFLALIVALSALPFREQIALVNSLEVGRLEDPMDWTCAGCEGWNKPLHSYVIEEKEVQIRAILSVYEQYTVLAFRYTANLKNVWQDLLWAFQVGFNVIQRQDEQAPKGCKVQREYDRMWARIREDVINGLNEHVHTRRLVITGISLGGGLACISFVDIQATGSFDNIEVVTFGAPRVGNRKWARWFDSITPSTRIYIKRDPIAFLPRCLTILCNYRQTGTPVVCNKKKQICTVKGRGYVPDVDDTPDFEILQNYIAEVKEHQDEMMNGDFGGILDHIYGYKKIINYTLVSA